MSFLSDLQQQFPACDALKSAFASAVGAVGSPAISYVATQFFDLQLGASKTGMSFTHASTVIPGVVFGTLTLLFLHQAAGNPVYKGTLATSNFISRSMDASVDVAWRGGIVAARSVKKASRNAARSLAAMQRNAARAHSSLPFSWRETGVRQDHRVIAIGGFRAWPLNQSARYN